MQPQVVYTEALESPRLSQKIALNPTQGKGVLIASFLVACKFETTSFSLEEQTNQNYIARCRSPLFKGVSKSIWIAMPKLKCCKAFLQEQEPNAITTERSLILSNWVSSDKLVDPLGLEQLEL